ncbi:sodium:calcium antiporter [Candidatus Woesearchaeota archaeon]|jgi:cation:H+ antiporter|nr:sodium:calcium antiporter [Candidatus Woesearchaeota archaeon]MBT5397059.1 sodium:calcium antiporter [Candidatus Woesearchaeota archaeon]MBT5924503.1 sodium:calcium antiporter [Candidatus Woesearchaeota archaeon]MBT6367395.1 sodium:calcium antiporter [Candidatus Woesearchaeota archaeon]MBT7762459.1 sodium:calcium antiporter [Candidatus Woesearchaeota archaeon]
MVVVTLILLVVSIILIWKSSDWITDSLVPMAKHLGTSYIAVTTLLVSLVVSLPEIFTATYSYFLGHLDIGLGVIIGSVMANIGLIVGISAIIKPLRVEKSVVIRDGIFMVIIAAVVLLFGSDLQYSRVEGWVLLLLFIPYAINVWSFEKWRPKKSQKLKVQNVQKSLSLIGHSKIKLKPSALTFILGAIVLVGGAYLFSSSLINLNAILQLPEILVGIVFGAIGTSIPNIAAAIQGTRKGYVDAAITETFGSNIFTLLVTLGIIVVLSPFSIAGNVFYFDLTWMIVMTLLFVALIFKGYRYKEESLTRYEGVALLLFYLTLLVIHIVAF